jgi:menaquinone-dependent protoporphyrinogen oxidase
MGESNMARILVIFGTTDGHTAKIAAAVESALRAGTAVVVDVKEPHETAPDPQRYDAVVVAASVHAGKFQKNITKWAHAHAALLNAKPSAFIGVCLGILQEEPAVQQEVQAILTRFFVATDWQPSSSIMVAGALPYTRYGWLKRWMMKRIAAKAGGDTDTTRDYEYTNWAELRVFSEEFGRRVTAVPETAMRKPA